MAFLCRKRVTVTSLKEALLFFDKVVLKGDFDESAYRTNPDLYDIGWLLDNGLLEFIDHQEYMGSGVYEVQDHVLSRLCDSDINLGSIFAPDTWGIIRGGDLNFQIAPNATVASSLVLQLRKRGFAYLPGERFRSDEYRFLGVIDYDENGELIRNPSAPFPMVSQFSEAADGFRAELRFCGNKFHDRAIVLLHPALVALHDGIVRCCAPMVGESRGETWYPTGDLGTGRFATHSDGGAFTSLATALATLSPASETKARIGSVVSSDLEAFPVNVENTSFPHIIDFRTTNREYLNRYFDSALNFVHRASLLSDSPDDAIRLNLESRAAELKGLVNDIRQKTLRRFGLASVSLTIGISGFAWFVSASDPASAVLALLPSLLPLLGDGSDSRSAATYFTKLTSTYGALRR